MKPFSILSLITAAITILTSNAFSQTQETASLFPLSFEVQEHVNGNELIQKMIAEKRKYNRNHNAEKVPVLPTPKHILNRSKPTIITFDGLEYLVQNNCVLGIKGLNLPEDVLIQMTAKLVFLDKVQFDYAEKIKRAYSNGGTDIQNIRNLNKWYLLTLRILSSTVNDIASLTKKHDASSLAANLIKMPVPNIDAINTPAMAQPLVKLAK